MFSNITAAQIGSAVRWVVTSAGAALSAQGVLVGFDWVTASGAIASLAMLGWSFYSNLKKVS